MNIYKSLNEVIEYIEKHLEEDISYNDLARIVGVNEYTFLRVFDLIANISVAEYIRKRRLSNAGVELSKAPNKIIDIAIKYNYDNSTSFSRAFEKFHNIKPSEAQKHPENLKVFPILHFEEQENITENIKYSIVELDEFSIYGKGIKTNNENIHNDAPKFFEEFVKNYKDQYGFPNYGMVLYEDRENSTNYEYWVLYDKYIEEFTEHKFPKCKWIKFEIPSREAEDIQEMSTRFYEEFLPSCKYNLKELPELEHYHENTTDFLIPIED